MKRALAAAWVLIVVAMLDARHAPAQTSDASRTSSPKRAVYLVSHGWHVGLALRRDEVPEGSWPEKEDLGRVQYLEVGWGDGDYYPAPRGTPLLALRAAFCSRWSVLQVMGFNGLVTEAFPRSKVLEADVSAEGLAALGRYLHQSYARDRDGRPIVLAPAPSGFGRIYVAREHYGLFNNSNTWTAKALRVAGCPIDVDAAVTAGAVLHQAVRFARVVRPGTFLHASANVPLQCQ